MCRVEAALRSTLTLNGRSVSSRKCPSFSAGTGLEVITSPERNQRPPAAVSKIGQPISVLHADSSLVSWGPTK